MSWCNQPNSPQCESSSSSTTTPFRGNQSGLACGSSSGQGTSGGSPPYSTQTPDSRFSQQGLNSSRDGFPYGVAQDFENKSTSSNAKIQHNTPQSSFQHSANYSQLGRPDPAMVFGDTSNVTAGAMSLQTDPTDHESALQIERLQKSLPRDISLPATNSGLLSPGWDNTTKICDGDQQRLYFGNDQNVTTSRQPDMRINTSLRSPSPLLGPVCDPSAASETGSHSQERPLEVLKGENSLLKCSPETRPDELFSGDIQDQTTTFPSSPETCTSQEVSHQVAFSPSAAASGLQPWVSAAPPVSTCVQQQALSSFDTGATVPLSGLSLPGSPSAGLGVRHPGAESQGVEREASVSSCLSAESGTASGALLVDIHTGVRHVDALANNSDSVLLPIERRNISNNKASGVEDSTGRRDFSADSSTCLAQLNNLIRRRQGRPQYECISCQHASDKLRAMKIHVRTHSGEQPCVCSNCRKGFLNPSNLTEHAKHHSCSSCGKTFLRLDSLIDHRITHTGERPFICELCGKTFRQRSSLWRHKRTHSEEKPYSCPICSKVFSSSRNLARHKKTHSVE